MFKGAIDYLNAKIETTGYVNSVLCLAEKIEREGKQYPAQCLGTEYKQIDLDPKGSLSYWRKAGDISISEEENLTGACSIQYNTTIPLKLVVFIKKDSPYGDCYFADNIAMELVSLLTTNNSALKGLFKAKSARVSATKIVTDSRTVASEEYSEGMFEARYSHAYFSIDFNLNIISNQNCFNSICSNG